MINRNINNKAKRAFLITDTHFGIRNSSKEWMDIMEDYFYNFFIPLAKKEYKPGDILIHLGDVYDSRQSINLRILNMSINIFEALSQIFKDGIYIIAGNHDCYEKNSNTINSLSSLKWIPNIHIYEEPEILEIQSGKSLMMPWRKDIQSERKCIEESGKCDYLFCHTDVRGLKFNNFVEVDEGLNIIEFKNFKKVYAGHIHYSQKMANFSMLGSPYALTRSDIGNPKGITILDLATGEEKYFLNDFSPKFRKIKFDSILNMTVPELQALVQNNFVDILISSNDILKAPLNIFLDLINNYKSIDFYPYNNQKEEEVLEGKRDDNITETFDLIRFTEKYIETLPYDEDTKIRIFNFIKRLKKVTENIINNVDNENIEI